MPTLRSGDRRSRKLLLTLWRTDCPNRRDEANRPAADTVVGYGHAQNRTSDGADLDLGEGIELPEWLKRAAVEQPFDASRQMAINANPYGPPGGSTATLDAVVAQNIPSSDHLLVPQPPLSIPDEEIDSLISQSAASASDQSRNANIAGGDVSDTSTFISESDLPEWIRQLAAADEAKKVEEMRKADEKASGERTADTDPRRRKSLPGESASAGPAASPWLARRDRSDESETVVADSWGTASAEKRATAPRVAEPVAAIVPAPVVAPVIDPVVAADAAPATSGPNMMRPVSARQRSRSSSFLRSHTC